MLILVVLTLWKIKYFSSFLLQTNSFGLIIEELVLTLTCY